MDIEKLKKELGLDQLTAVATELKAQNDAVTKEKADAARKAAEEARITALIERSVDKEGMQKAADTVKALEEKLDKNAGIFASTVEKMQSEILAYQDQIKQVLSARDGMGVSQSAFSVSKALMGDQETFEKDVENVVLLSYITEKNMFETAYGEQHVKAVNSSSSIEVSDDAYETIFSNRILRDMQKLMVVGAMFEELPMGAKNLTMMIEPESQLATWVDAPTYGTDATTGNEVKVALLEKTFKTYKLASKAYMTDETEEDAIVALLPIIRRHLIESHVRAVETAFMTGTGTGQPTGLLKLATDASTKVATAAKADGSVVVTAKEILKLRRKLGQHGLDVSKLALVVSMDAYYDLLEDEGWQDIDKVGNAAIKLQGQVGRIYGLPVLVSNYFPAKAVSAEFAVIVYRDNFVIPRQRTVTVEAERQASKQRDAYYVTQRLNLQPLIDNKGVVSATYAAA